MTAHTQSLDKWKLPAKGTAIFQQERDLRGQEHLGWGAADTRPYRGSVLCLPSLRSPSTSPPHAFFSLCSQDINMVCFKFVGEVPILEDVVKSTNYFPCHSSHQGCFLSWPLWAGRSEWQSQRGRATVTLPATYHLGKSLLPRDTRIEGTGEKSRHPPFPSKHLTVDPDFVRPEAYTIWIVFFNKKNCKCKIR